ncbi:hypothetical protein [Deinococcus pimensis]|uniref:hypothetical protein n=1 Tax=Deinococcus pimensis TaxID=309888 RepID=UPI00047F0221|nr:hypothetical protein [Deinococcus pimensis]
MKFTVPWAGQSTAQQPHLQRDIRIDSVLPAVTPANTVGEGSGYFFINRGSVRAKTRFICRPM